MKKLLAVGKRGPNATFDLIFLGLVWPCVGEFDGFTINRIYGRKTFGSGDTIGSDGGRI